jgi:hypothetical protein
MAAITATHWTETVQNRFIQGKKKRNTVKLILDVTGAGTYPSSGGIPLPTTLGMVRNVDYVIVTQYPLPTTVAAGLVNNYVWNYDQENHSIHGYHQSATDAAIATGLVELPTTWEPSSGFGTAAPVMYVEAVGW